MTKHQSRLASLGALAASAGLAGAFALAPAPQTPTAFAAPRFGAMGPSTTTAPYLVPNPALGDMVSLTSILTVGDSVGGYRMVGIPDGLGAFAGQGDSMNLLVNHELGSTRGELRGHASKGAFVSRWAINRNTLKVEAGQDLVTSPGSMFLWDTAKKAFNAATTAIERLCSADMAAPGAFWWNGLGTQDRILLNGEETTGGRGFAWIATGAQAGQAWQLPRMGRGAFENLVANPMPQAKTIVIGLEDGNLSTAPVVSAAPSQLSVYIGAKQASGSTIERAGLTNGKLYGIQVEVDGVVRSEEDDTAGLGLPWEGGRSGAGFKMVAVGNDGDVSGLTAAQLEQSMIEKQALRMRRIEDGAWDPRPGYESHFYFVTTSSFTTNSRLWRLRFWDIQNPEAGGALDLLLNGDEGHKMLDNITVDKYGRVILQEDPGNEPYIARVWAYGIDTKEFVPVAWFNPALFGQGQPGVITLDEESSGIIDASDLLGGGYYLLDAQVHKTLADTELVEMGQLLAMWIDPRIATPVGSR